MFVRRIDAFNTRPVKLDVSDDVEKQQKRDQNNNRTLKPMQAIPTLAI